ncbi:MAG: uroporphyrinogen-III C-methyltransferase [Gammaproteobacteria bacterium]
MASHERPPRAPIVVAIVALVLALIALAAAATAIWSWTQMSGEQARVSRLEGRVSSLSGQIAALDKGTASAKSVNTLAGRLEDLRQSEKQRLDAIEKNLRKVTARIAGVDIAYREDEAAALMRLAQARLELQSDPAGAARALGLADKALAATNDPALAPVHLALTREIAALQAVPTVDVAKAYVQLETLTGQVGALPLAGDALANERAPTAGTASSGFSWGGVGAAFKRAFSPLIVVRHGAVARPLLPPNEAYFVRQNLKLELASAQLALLQGNAKAWKSSLGQAQSWLSEWFATSDAQVKKATEKLNGLAALDLAPKLPTLGAALAKLGAIRAQAASAVPAPSAATR